MKKRQRENSGLGRNKKRSSDWNNLIAVITLSLIIFSIWSFWNTQRAIEVTSKAVGQGYVSFCYMAHSPDFVINWPWQNQIVQGWVTIRGECPGCQGNVTNVTYYFKKGSYEKQMAVAYNATNGWFQKTASTIQKGIPDGNCNYVTFSRIYFSDLCIKSQDRTGSFFTVNNVNMPPVWSNFSNGWTTNFLQLSSWVNISRIVISDGRFGKIYVPSFMNFDEANLDKGIFFRFNNIEIKDSLKCMGLQMAESPVYLTFYNLTFVDPGILKDGEECTGCLNKHYSNGTLNFSVSLAGNYSVYEAGAFKMNLTDDTAFSAKHQNELTGMYVYLTEANSSTTFYSPEIVCTLDIYPDLASFGVAVMRYNHSASRYQSFERFIKPGDYEWHVVCNASMINKGVQEKTKKITISNRCPVCTFSLPDNFTWGKNTVLNGPSLDDYCSDPDGDAVSFTFSPYPVNNITVFVNSSNHEFMLQPETNWYGNRTVMFEGWDPYCSVSAKTNEVLLVVENTLPPRERVSTRSSPQLPVCIPKWECSDWSNCKPINKRTRKCTDLNNCNATMYMPETEMNCTYVPTCYDKLKNGAETGVDCGGLCLACPTCFDKIKNQGETGIDCGGPCSECPTCEDGIKNQLEEDIDCGGPCIACPTCFDGIMNGEEEMVDCGGKTCEACEKSVEVQKPYFTAAFWSIFIISLLLALAIAFALRRKIFEWLKGLWEKIALIFKRKDRAQNIIDIYVDDLVLVLDKADEISRTKDSEDFNDLIDGFFSYVFGSFEEEKILREIQFSMFNERTRNYIIEAFNCWKGGRIDEAIRQVQKASKAVFFESLNSAGFSDLEIFNSAVLKVGSLADTRREILKKFIYEIYLRLPMDAKGKVYKTLREIDNADQKMVRDKEIAMGVVLLFMVSFALIFGVGNFASTGFNVFSPFDEQMTLVNLPEVSLMQNQGFEYLAKVDGSQGDLTFSVYSRLAEISRDGWLKVYPMEQPGVYFIGIEAVDSKGNIAKGTLKVEVIK